MESKFIDEFFSTGRLRLSSFKKFATHPDEERGDRNEGVHILYGKGKEQTLFAVTRHGFDAYVLSATQLATPDIFGRFGSMSALMIKETSAFGAAIARQIAGYRFGVEGPCSYKDGSIECDIGDFKLDQLKANPDDPNEKTLDLGKMGGFVLSIAGTEPIFRKRLLHQHQSEYRWAWLTDHEVPDFLDINVPDARQFCEKVSLPSD